VYPPTAGEAPKVFAVPSSYLDKTSTWYAWGDIPQSADVDKLADLQDSAAPGGQLAGVVDDHQLLGNALMLTEELYDRIKSGRRVPDFNLDGDRGYGFLCWAQRGDPAPDFPNPLSVPVDLNFIP
jgi:hypothetical protein